MRRIEERGKVTFNQAIKDFIQGWVSYGGRSTRAGYWWACLGEIIFLFVYALVMLVLGFIPFLDIILMIPFWILSVLIMIAQFASIFRRFRDVGFKTAPIVIWLVCALIPFLNTIAAVAGFVFTLLPTDQFVAEKENWLVRGKDTVDETQTTTAAQPQLTKAAPVATTASPSLPTVVFYPDGREQEVK